MCPVNSRQLPVSEGKNLYLVIFLNRLSSECLGSLHTPCELPGAQTDSAQVSPFILLFTCREYWMSKKLAAEK